MKKRTIRDPGWSPYLAIDLDLVRAGKERAFDIEDLLGGNEVQLNAHTNDGVAIVHIRGSLRFHSSRLFDSYEDIVVRIESAMTGADRVDQARMMGVSEVPDARPAKAVVLSIDSPGGEAAGSMDIHRMIRHMSKVYGVPVYAFANETMCSAAYAIGSAAQEIWCADTATVGSIGVIATLFDRTAQNARSGQLVELVTTGKFKGDGHADRPLTDGIRKRMQRRVDRMGEVFFQLVADARDTTPDAVVGLEAGVFIGKDALRAGLVDGVERWDKFLKLVGQSVADSGDPEKSKSAA